MDPGVIGVFIPIVAIVGGIALAIIKTMGKMRIRELQIRERIAMIEKGLVPPPEMDPAGFDRAMNQHERNDWTSRAPRHRPHGHSRPEDGGDRLGRRRTHGQPPAVDDPATTTTQPNTCCM